MKFFLACTLVIFSSISNAQSKWYVAAKNGLSMRDKPDAKATVVSKIPYGASIVANYPDSMITISTEGLMGSWVKTTHGGKAGYVINSYLLPEPPPKTGVKTMKQYLLQLSQPAGTALVIKKGSMNNVEEGGSEIKKQLYKNGGEHHQTTGYEWHNDTYFLPDFTTKQGFILLRLIPEFESIFKEGDVFPTKTTTIKKGDVEYTITVDGEDIGDEKWIKRITIEFADGAVNTFEMFQLGSQLVISFGGGV